MAKKTSKKIKAEKPIDAIDNSKVVTATDVIKMNKKVEREEYKHRIARKIKKYTKYIQTTPVRAYAPKTIVRCPICKHPQTPADVVIDINYTDETRYFILQTVCRKCAMYFGVANIDEQELHDLAVNEFPTNDQMKLVINSEMEHRCNVCGESRIGKIYYNKNHRLPIAIDYCLPCFDELNGKVVSMPIVNANLTDDFDFKALLNEGEDN